MNDKPAIPTRNLVIFAIASLLVMLAWTWVQNKFWPQQRRLTAEEQREVRTELAPLAGLVGAGGNGLGDFANFFALEAGRNIPPEDRARLVAFAQEERRKAELARPKAPAVPAFKPELVELGSDGFNLLVRFTTRGGGVDRVIVPRFPQANQYGKEVKQPDGRPQPLHLIPSPEDRPQAERDDLEHDERLPSFLLYHYATPEEQRPEPTLGEQKWEIVARPQDRDADVQTIAFETKLPEYGVKITKTFTLQRHAYHVGLTLRFEKLPDATPRPLRYQLAGGHGLPIEGVWYTSVFRNFVVGLKDAKGAPVRHLETGAEIHTNLGSDPGPASRGDGEIQYAAVAGQYFVSATCVDDEQKDHKFIERARGTPEGSHPKDKPMLGDITPRLVSTPLKLGDAPVEHRFVLYHGPVKVRQLYQFNDGSIPDELVERYEKTLNLRTLTDYRSDTWLGSFAHFIGWSDLTIAFTNLMHWLLGFLMRTLQVPVLAIITLTVMVRLLLMPLSRRQTASMQRMQEKMAALQPKLKELEERFKREGRDTQELHQAKMKLMLENGVNPMSQLGGCLLLFAQMPIFMGLYYSLQENVFFRLESALWGLIPNLAAPDMLFKWGEKIPFVSDPSHLGSFFYLGPYFNILPLLAVGLMLVQQWLMTPPPADEQQAQQQKMMKFMMVFFALFFYKTPSGLVLYFIISSLWGLAERKLFPKKPPAKPGEAGGRGGDDRGGDAGGNGAKLKDRPKPPAETWLQRKMREVMEAAQKRDNTTRRGPAPKRPRPR